MLPGNGGWLYISGKGKDRNNYRDITMLGVPGKFLANLLLLLIRAHLLKYQTAKEFGFTFGKSTVDRILELLDLEERQLTLRQRLLPAQIDLKIAFDSVHCKT